MRVWGLQRGVGGRGLPGLTRRAVLVAGGLAFVQLAGCGGERKKNPPPYGIDPVTVGSDLENRFFYNSHHFMTAILTSAGAISIRPHPGRDPNGWGSSWYPMAFLPAAVLRGSTLQASTDGWTAVQVQASGPVCQSTSSSYGTWTCTYSFSYDPVAKRITGGGRYQITLSGTLSSSTGDLNLCKIASNYLDNVPLLGGGTGDTGDMRRADVVGDSFSFSWDPPTQTSYFPQNATNRLVTDVIGQYNNVDSAAQGYAAIAAAYKPSLKVTYASRSAGLPMIFGGIYDTNRSQQFWADNIGITPLVLYSSTWTSFDFDVGFESVAIAGDP